MDITIELGKENNIDELEQLYNDLNDYLAIGINYPGWIKGIYPIRQNAMDGVKNDNLYVAKHNGKIIALMDFADELSIQSKMKAIRLDVYEGNTPAIRLYEKCDFSYIDTVDLGLGNYGLN